MCNTDTARTQPRLEILTALCCDLVHVREEKISKGNVTVICSCQPTHSVTQLLRCALARDAEWNVVMAQAELKPHVSTCKYVYPLEFSGAACPSNIKAFTRNYPKRTRANCHADIGLPRKYTLGLSWGIPHMRGFSTRQMQM